MLAAVVPFGIIFTLILRLAISATSKGDYGKFGNDRADGTGRDGDRS
jgi:hypothetical protein